MSEASPIDHCVRVIFVIFPIVICICKCESFMVHLSDIKHTREIIQERRHKREDRRERERKRDSRRDKIQERREKTQERKERRDYRREKIEESRYKRPPDPISHVCSLTGK